MDYGFTQTELSYLDDLMPELLKRSKEDDNNNKRNNICKKKVWNKFFFQILISLINFLS